MRPNQAEDYLERFSELTKGQKIDAIKCVIANLHSLANRINNTRPDIAHALDAIVDGRSMSTKKLVDRMHSTTYGGNVFVHDSKDGSFSRIILKNKAVVDDIISVEAK